MKLSQLVTIAANNEECVVLKVNKNAEMDLICLGCFDGNETLLRITKGKNHTATIFREKENVSWEWGRSGRDIVSDKLTKCGKLIEECVKEDFGIYIGENEQRIKNTLYIKTLEDKKQKECKLEILYHKGKHNTTCQIHRNDEHFKWFDNRNQAKEYIDEKFTIKNEKKYTSDNGCVVEEYVGSYK